MHLYITYKRYSSWSLRPWLLLKVAGIEFEETILPFAHDDSLMKFASEHRVPATVPILKHNGLIIWDSLAIVEYLAEQHPQKALWPTDPGLRAFARCVSAEMHTGFVALRTEHPMNCHRVHPMQPSARVKADLARLAVIWQKSAELKKTEGEFLCGEFSIADAMFAPVAWRVKGYGLQISDKFAHWSEKVMALPAMAEWVRDGSCEPWRVEETEQIGL